MKFKSNNKENKKSKLNKKAALDLSINAIVVLILAITMLGLGLGFMYKMFGGTADKLDKMTGQLDSQMKEQLKESGKRLAFESTQIQMKKSSKTTIAFALKNDLGTTNAPFSFNTDINSVTIDTDGSLIGSGSATQCYQSFKSDTADDVKGKVVITTPKDIKINADEVKVMGMQIEATSGADADTYQCSMIVAEPDFPDKEYTRVDFEVIVK